MPRHQNTLEHKYKFRFPTFFRISSPEEKKSVTGSPTGYRLFLLGELLFPDVSAPQLDVEHALHGTQNLLVRGGGALLEVLDDGGDGVAFGGEFLLGHFIGLLVPALLDCVCDLGANSLGLDDIVAAVDLGQVLPFTTTGVGGLVSSA